MSQRTKKVGSTGRFGPRYGVSVRRRIGTVEKKQKRKHECPSCSKINVKRVSTGIFKCSSCDYQFASGAYYPTKVD
ncbi:MAG: 50S ribosomal protein L37ae [Methanobacteriota archaeon]|nr:MAG: 50S ribosomal protein L37ae [Euryarchaeota archaeon]